MAITWRSLMGQTPDPVRALASAQNSFNDMFGTLNKVLENRGTSMEEGAKQAFLNELYGSSSVEGFDQSRDVLVGKLQSLSPENQAAVRPLLEQRRSQLMQATVADQQYKDVQAERGQRDVVSGLQEALSRASTPEEAARVQEAIGIYQANNMLNGQGGAALLKEALGRGKDLGNEAWTSKERSEQEKDWAHKASKRPLELEQMRAQTEETRRRGEGGSTSLGALGPLMKAVEAIADNSIAGDKAVVEKSPFSGPLAVDTAGRAAATKILSETGVSFGDLFTDKNNFVDKVVKSGSAGDDPVLTIDGKNLLFRTSDGEAVEVPFSQKILEDVIRQDNGNILDPSVDSVVTRLRNLVSQPHVTEAMDKFLTSNEKINLTQKQKADAIANLLYGQLNAQKKRQ